MSMPIGSCDVVYLFIRSLSLSLSLSMQIIHEPPPPIVEDSSVRTNFFL